MAEEAKEARDLSLRGGVKLPPSAQLSFRPPLCPSFLLLLLVLVLGLGGVRVGRTTLLAHDNPGVAVAAWRFLGNEEYHKTTRPLGRRKRREHWRILGTCRGSTFIQGPSHLPMRKET